jgi:hypothetical protein
MTAVKICSISILLGLFTSCYDGEINGRKYYLKKTCIKSHIENVTIPHVGEVWIQMPTDYEVCDKYKTDTIWETK